jgi:hypothetical protein
MNPQLDYAAALRAAGFEAIPGRGWCRLIERAFLPLTVQEHALNAQGGQHWPGQTWEVYAVFYADVDAWIRQAEEDAATDCPDWHRWRHWRDLYAGGFLMQSERSETARETRRHAPRRTRDRCHRRGTHRRCAKHHRLPGF